MNTANTTPSVDNTLVTKSLMQFGNGKYSKRATEYAAKCQHWFKFTDEQADRFGHQLMTDMGRLNMDVDAIKVSKANKDGMVTVSEQGKTGKNAVIETPALTLVAGINELEKAIARIPDGILTGCIDLPKYLQFNAKKTE